MAKWLEKEVVSPIDGIPPIEEWQSARCSACGKYHTTPYMYYFDEYAYCPNCGQAMDGKDEPQNVILVYDGVSEAVRCAMCSNPNKSDRGCDGACSYDEKLYKRIMDAIDESRVDTPQTDCDNKDEPQTNGYQTFNGTSVYVSRFTDEPQERSE